MYGRTYSDGSRLDGPMALLARNGWAFVAVNDDDEIFAIAYGLPPEWIEDIPGTEAWALLQAASLALPGTTFFVDCQPCVDAVHKGLAFTRSNKNPLARVHSLLAEAMSDVPPEATVWIPSHMKAGACGTVVRGDGFLVTEVDVEANDVADRYAKRAVLAHRVHFRIREEIKSHDALTAINAMWVAWATLLANGRSSEPARDTQASRLKAAAAGAEKRKLAAARILSGTLYRGSTPDGQTYDGDAEECSEWWAQFAAVRKRMAVHHLQISFCHMGQPCHPVVHWPCHGQMGSYRLEPHQTWRRHRRCAQTCRQ